MDLYVPHVGPETSPAEAARLYAEAGWYVIPVERTDTGKNPGSILGKNWQAQSSRDLDQIAEWFSSAYPPRNIALHVGRSGAVAFDHDKGDLPPELIEALNDHHPPHQSTRPGRAHYIFKQPIGRNIGNSGGKLGNEWGEVRGQNGVIIVAPSINVTADNRMYHWKSEGVVPELPGNISQMLSDASPRVQVATDDAIERFLDTYTSSSSPKMLDAVVNHFEENARRGSRHETLVECACWAMREARAGFYPARSARQALWTIFNQTVGTDRYAEPEFEGVFAWAIGQAAALSYAELERQVAPDRSEVTTEQIDAMIADMLDTIALDSLPDPRWLVRGWFELDSVARIIGKSRHGKTFVAIDLAAHVALGRDWNGARVEQGLVIYMAAEGGLGVKKRIRAWESHHKIRVRNLLVLPRPVQSKSHEWNVLVEACRKLQPSMIFLDTQARVTVGLEENSAKDMGEFVDQAEKLREATKACVIPVHHLGHQGGEGRGSTSVFGAVTSEVKVERDFKRGRIKIENVKQKNAEEADAISVRLQSIPLWEDPETGELVTSAIIVSEVADEQDKALAGRGKVLQVVLDTLRTEYKWMTTSELVDTAGVSRASVVRAIGDLKGLVEVRSEGERHNSPKSYRAVLKKPEGQGVSNNQLPPGKPS